MCLRARKTKRYDITWDLCFKQALQFQKPKTKGRQIWPPPWAAKGPATPLRMCALDWCKNQRPWTTLKKRRTTIFLVIWVAILSEHFEISVFNERAILNDPEMLFHVTTVFCLGSTRFFALNSETTVWKRTKIHPYCQWQKMFAMDSSLVM